MITLFDLSGFQRDLLTIIAGHDQPSGQQIKTELEDARDEEINHGRLYPNLDVLVNKGYVEKGQIDRRTNFYQITDEGRTALREHREWEAQYFQETALA
ncbi:PadR family transcriptional regulator [Halegenticoccus tardaugens]|uniref:PadR family transcriptional regulator n=1 Tax=Halegenticoccus tardaugens TaxID=2071624 RepID=UPI00100AD96A|nr:PadR family transcriptional regulator [Halegenticoccus tardaugens]